MALYYLKKLERQEMGSPDSKGRTHRGRYIYLSKNSGDFFPHLSKTILNDTLVLPIVMFFAPKKIYAKFVYHNSKYALLSPPKGPRNEYRLYLNNDLDNQKQYFRIGDIVVIEKIAANQDNQQEAMSYVYSFSLFDSTSEHYQKLSDIIDVSPMNGAHAIFDKKLGFVSRPDVNNDMEVSISEDIKKTVKEEQRELVETIEQQRDDEIENIRGANLFNSISFRDFVLLAYGYRCAITGKAIVYKNLNNLEAAHIQPKAHSGTFLPCNGLALCRDMHWAFDKGFITISDDFTVIVHDKMKNSTLSEYDGQKIIVPIESYFQPEKKFLKHHRDNVFGLFIHSGSIRSL